VRSLARSSASTTAGSLPAAEHAGDVDGSDDNRDERDAASVSSTNEDEEDDDDDMEDEDVERATWMGRALETPRAAWEGWNERLVRWWDGRTQGEREDRSR
jgi:hypothetical protein